jgi:hypothetical protein
MCSKRSRDRQGAVLRGHRSMTDRRISWIVSYYGAKAGGTRRLVACSKA